MDIPFDAPFNESHGRFPYSGVDVLSNKKAVQAVAKKTNYAELRFPEQKEPSEQRQTTISGPRLSLNDQDFDHDYSEEINKKGSLEFLVLEDPFEGSNPFSNEIFEETNQEVSSEDNSNEMDRIEQFIPEHKTNQISKSLENLELTSNDEDTNEYMQPSTPFALPRSFSNPTYGSSIDSQAAIKATQPSSYPQGTAQMDNMEFYEEDFQILMGQGYSREEIKKALIIADNNFAMARTILRGYHGTRTAKE